VLLCADDYALNAAVDEAILELAASGRMKALGCMTRSPRWPEAAVRLQGLPAQVQIGLHFDLTEPFGGRTEGLGSLICKSYLGLLSRKNLCKAFQEQIGSFVASLGREPDFIDGHQHVHQLPVIRDVLCQALQERYRGRHMPWVRNTVPAAVGLGRKARLLEWLGGRRLLNELQCRGIPTNTGFAGVYGFDARSAAEYGARMDHWLAAAAIGTVIMCHPARYVVEGDPIAQARVFEFEWLRQSPASWR
jgi:hypothetical protein